LSYYCNRIKFSFLNCNSLFFSFMFKSFFLLLFLFFAVFTLNAQSFSRVPKFVSAELGYRYIPSTSFDIKNQGMTLLVDYAWQLSGFTGKPAAFISVPLGYTYLFGGNSSNSGRILSYGWTVRHELKSKGKAIPFLGYGLLLNQLKIENIDGAVFGHQTCLNFGYRFKSEKKTNYYIKLEYSYSRYPHLGAKKSDSMQALEFKTGIRF
jgi:hypothetical protein